jgi:hypothetical protein
MANDAEEVVEGMQFDGGYIALLRHQSRKDRIDGNGPDMGYSVYIMENGDKFFARYIGQVQNDSGNFTDTLFGPITGGTGKLLGIQGTVRGVANCP